MTHDLARIQPQHAAIKSEKYCAKCDQVTPRYKSGACQPCHLKRSAEIRVRDKEKIKLMLASYYQRNKEKFAAKRDKWRGENREKELALNAAYRAANQDKVKASETAWRKANAEKHRLNKMAWRHANPEKPRKTTKEWFKANPHASRVYAQNRRAKIKAVGGILSTDIAEKLLKLQKGKCPVCRGDLLKDDHQLDHIMPIALGGSNTDDNIQLLHKLCNLQKNAKHPVDFMQSKGFLI